MTKLCCYTSNFKNINDIVRINVRKSIPRSPIVAYPLKKSFSFFYAFSCNSPQTDLKHK